MCQLYFDIREKLQKQDVDYDLTSVLQNLYKRSVDELLLPIRIEFKDRVVTVEEWTICRKLLEIKGYKELSFFVADDIVNISLMKPITLWIPD